MWWKSDRGGNGEVDVAFREAVVWLLGPQLVAGLRRIISYQFLKSQLDQRAWMTGTRVERFKAPPDGEALWWDYIADTGDDTRAMYSLATLLYSDLYELPDSPERELAFDGEPGRRLPRGAFLFVGGDTAYPVADRATLAAQFAGPFQRAWNDLCAAGRVSPADPLRPIYGLPGNHDYYDGLDGFCRQFCRRIGSEHDAELTMPGFEREQAGTYVAIALPHGWWLWALDIELGWLDARQRAFFQAAHPGVPDRLIVATPEPSTVDGLLATTAAPISAACADLGLEQAFLSQPLAAGRCRLDLSGDTHNYQRYFGPDSYGGEANYASVVSGGGGAFLHPTSIDLRQIERRAEFPSQATSHAEIAAGLVNWLQLFRSGLISLLSGVVAAILYFTAALVPTSKLMFSHVLERLFGLCYERTTWSPGDGACRALPPPTQYAYGLVILASICAAVYLLVVARRYARGRGSGSARHVVSGRRYQYGAILAVIGIALPWMTIGLAGEQTAAHVLANVLSATIVLAYLIGLVAFAVLIGARGRPSSGQWLFGAIGLVHALLQILVPLTLVRMMSGRAFIVAGLVVFGFRVVGGQLMKRQPWALLACWFVAGIAQLALPRLVAGDSMFSPSGLGEQALCVVIALAIGWVWTAINLGWYLAVTFSLGGHGNEAAMVARVWRYKQFLRFRIDPDGSLTGYAIAIDQPHLQSRRLRPRVVDKFTIRPAP
ncbi:MAG TPA: hypothetical protein VF469_41985 [Kofleriaceae bacterium]